MIEVLLKRTPSLLGTALGRVLAVEPGITVLASLGQDDDVVQVGGRLSPDVVVIDGSQADPVKLESECLELCRTLPTTRALVVVCARTPAIGHNLARLAPQLGFVTTDEGYEHFAAAIRRLAAGAPVIGADVALATLKADDNPLTGREREVLGLMVTGASTQEVADLLYLRVGTVRNYVSSAIAKVGARTRIDAIRIAQEAGWI